LKLFGKHIPGTGRLFEKDYRKKTAPAPAPAPAPPPPAPPPPPPARGPVRDRYTRIWDDNVSAAVVQDIEARTGYRKREIIQEHLAVFNQYMDPEAQREERYELWESYVQNMVMGDYQDHEAFFDDVGIFDTDFDWSGWREAMGYSRNAALLLTSILPHRS
jgi:hypothetical protein